MSQVNPERNILGPLGMLRAPLTRLRVAVLRVRYRTSVTYGDQFRLGAGAVINSPGPIAFGDRVRIARGLHVETLLRVGHDVLMSSHVAFIGNDHPFDDSDRPITSFQRAATASVTIGDDCFIGYGATIVGPVHIGTGSIVGARSVVTSDVPANSVVAGVPARLLRSRRPT